MVRMVMQMANRLFRKSQKQKIKVQQEIIEQGEKKLAERYQKVKIYEDIAINLELMKDALGRPSDIIFREFVLRIDQQLNAAIVFIDEMVNKDLINDFILHPLMIEGERITSEKTIWDTVHERLVSAGEITTITDIHNALSAVLSGDTVLFLDNCDKALVIGSKSWATKSISEPRAEAVVRGPREGLSETIVFSLAMIRRRLKDPDFRVRTYKIGERTKTCVTLLYIEGLTDEKLVADAQKRIEDIKIDGILETGYIEELIQDQIFTPFPQIQNTERPDAVVAHLLEGKFAILVDGTPHALIAPAIFSQFYHSPEDYYERFLISSFLRFVRLISFFVALMLPAFYIAFTSFHPEMIPQRLAIAMAAGRATVPFAAIIEALVMEFSVEILREASVRLPSPIGPTIGIVGALVIGDAAVSAGLVSPAMVIVVGLTTISSYANPSYSAAISVRLMRFPFMIMAAFLGLYGIMLFFFLLCGHLVQLRSFGVPYMAPYAPLHLGDLKDSFFRTPWNYMENRPVIFRPQDSKRQEQVDPVKDGKT